MDGMRWDWFGLDWLGLTSLVSDRGNQFSGTLLADSANNHSVSFLVQ